MNRNYVCSDIHGHYDKWRALLTALDLRPDDTLYVLGDMTDRGPDGVKVLQDMMLRPNVIPILGNHEMTAAVGIPTLLKEITDKSLAELNETDVAVLSDWLRNGGGRRCGDCGAYHRRNGRICWNTFMTWSFTRRWRPAGGTSF